MAVVHEEPPYEAYAERLAACDFFVCPFPYGNMNSIVDAALLGLPGRLPRRRRKPTRTPTPPTSAA